jgi:hypothetical protein
MLETTGKLDQGNTLIYHASSYDCRDCPLKANAVQKIRRAR